MSVELICLENVYCLDMVFVFIVNNFQSEDVVSTHMVLKCWNSHSVSILVHPELLFDSTRTTILVICYSPNIANSRS